MQLEQHAAEEEHQEAEEHREDVAVRLVAASAVEADRGEAALPVEGEVLRVVVVEGSERLARQVPLCLDRLMILCNRCSRRERLLQT